MNEACDAVLDGWSAAVRVARGFGSVIVHPSAEIADDVSFEVYSDGATPNVTVGPGTRIGPGCRFVVSSAVTIGAFSTLHRGLFCAGGAPVTIGDSVWIGQDVVLNCADEVQVGHGVGIGARSQLWTHIKHGDPSLGCRFDSHAPLTLEDDVWLVGQCLVSPIRAEWGSMAMLGSVVTRDMHANRTYAGIPARDVTDRLGPQFDIPPLAMRVGLVERVIKAAAADQGLRVAVVPDQTALDPTAAEADVVVLVDERRAFAEWDAASVGLVQRLRPQVKLFAGDWNALRAGKYRGYGDRAGAGPG